MPRSDYRQIREENLNEYGRGTRHLELLSTRYTNRTHFVFELLQNAEDAQASQIQFTLFDDRLEITHDGLPFDESDVRAICGVGESTKADDLTQIGTFGIGFKSVYVYTSAPEIHSGDENFRIEHYIRPHAVEPREIQEPWTTLFVLPFDRENINPETAVQEIGKRLGDELSTTTVLFLRHLKEIAYKLPGCYGTYRRRETDNHGAMRQVEVGHEDENWLIFERPVPVPDNSISVPVEVAFKLEPNGTDRITQIEESPLVVYFPTERDTRLGFLIQGPYRTTLARDNIPHDDEWNQKLISETAELVVDSLQQLKDMDLLTVSLLETLPIRETDFPEDSLFHPIFRKVRESLMTRDFLPANDGTFVSAENAKLARGDAIRNLLSHAQLAALFSMPETKIKWLSADITLNRTPTLHGYLMDLGIEEVTPDMFARRVSTPFFSGQSNDWFIEFYRFLSEQQAVVRFLLQAEPILRLQDGTHVSPFAADESPNAYLPIGTDTDTSLPIVMLEISQDEEARRFLENLGLREWDIVEDVIRNILPKYSDASSIVPVATHRRDFDRIERANSTDSEAARKRLRNALQATPFILAESPDENGPVYRKPEELYLPNDELRLYFEGNSSYSFVKLGEYPESAQTLFGTLGVEDAVRIKRRRQNHQGYVIISDYYGWHERGIHGFDPAVHIDGLKHAINNLTLEKSALIWNKIAIPNADCIKGVVEQATRQDYSNRSSEERVSNAFGLLLMDKAWLPDLDGNFRKPSELTLNQLPDSFTRDERLANQLGMQSNRDDVPSLIRRLANMTGRTPEELQALLFLPEPQPAPTPTQPSFPERLVIDPERRANQVLAALDEAPDQEYEDRLRSVRISRNWILPKPYLKGQYTNDADQMVCQICHEEMPFRNRDGEYHFDAVEVLKDYFTKEYAAQSLALCPKCSPQYKEFIKRVPEAMEELKNLLMVPNSSNFSVPLKLGNRQRTLRFVERHWRDIQAVLAYYENADDADEDSTD